MKRRLSNYAVGALVAYVVLFMGGCTFTKNVQLPQSQEEAYFEALRFYNARAESYKFHFLLAPEEVQAKWTKKINPIFKEASDILDIWDQTLIAGQDAATSVERWENIKRQLIIILSNEQIIGEKK